MSAATPTGDVEAVLAQMRSRLDVSPDRVLEFWYRALVAALRDAPRPSGGALTDEERRTNMALSVWSNTCNAHCSEEDRVHGDECRLASGLYHDLARAAQRDPQPSEAAARALVERAWDGDKEAAAEVVAAVYAYRLAAQPSAPVQTAVEVEWPCPDCTVSHVPGWCQRKAALAQDREADRG